MCKRVSGLLWTFILIAPPLAWAEELDVSTPVLDVQAIGELRAQLGEIGDLYAELASRSGNPLTEGVAERLQARSESLTNEHLAFFIAAGVDLGELLDAVRELDRLTSGPREVSGLGGSKSAGLPSAQYSGVCGSDRSSTDAVFAGRIVLDIAKAVWAAASRACDETIAGFNTSLACIVVDEILFVAETVFDEIGFCDDSVNSAEIEGAYERLGHLHTDLEALQADVTLDMQLMIEENLMLGPPTSVIVSYQIPEAFGGHLGLVSTVVQSAMDRMVAAGQRINNAQLLFDQAEDLASKSQFKRAYLMYRRAYVEVVRLP